MRPSQQVAQQDAKRKQIRTLVEGFTGGDRAIQTGLNMMWSDQQHWPADLRARYQIDPKIQDFIMKAMKGEG